MVDCSSRYGNQKTMTKYCQVQTKQNIWSSTFSKNIIINGDKIKIISEIQKLRNISLLHLHLKRTILDRGTRNRNKILCMKRQMFGLNTLDMARQNNNYNVNIK